MVIISLLLLFSCSVENLKTNAPNQNNLENIPVKVAMGVGGAFDYLSASVPRAPKVLRKLGFEWLFRLMIQPWRLKRQLALLKYLWLLTRAG